MDGCVKNVSRVKENCKSLGSKIASEIARHFLEPTEARVFLLKNLTQENCRFGSMHFSGGRNKLLDFPNFLRSFKS
jgi:hypothetical protein